MARFATPLHVNPGVVFCGAAGNSISGFETDANHLVEVDHWYESWQSRYGLGFNSSKAQGVHDAGRVNHVTWEPWDPAGGATQPTYKLTTITAGDHDPHIIAWADGAKAFGEAIFLRFAHEMNGDWYPWGTKGGVNGNTPADYAAAWRHVWYIFQDRGVRNVTWVWCPNRPFPSSTPMADLWPGPAYVGWVGLDAYNQGTDNGSTWLDVPTTFDQGFADLRAITTSKPIAICETGCSENGGSKAGWFDDLFAALKTSYSYVNGLLYFNFDKSLTTSNWLITTSTAARDAYRVGIADSRYGVGALTTFALDETVVVDDFQMSYRGLLLGAGPYDVRPPVEGLADLPDLRTSDRTRLRRHGMLAGDDFAAGRTITVDVPIVAAGSAFAAAVDAFAAAFFLTEDGGQLDPLIFKVPGVAGGGTRRVLARVRKRALPVGPAWVVGGAIASVMLDCPDPRIYDNVEQSVVTSLAATPSGHTWNNTWNLSWGTAGVSGSIFVNNAGSFPTPPSFRIDGPVTNPSIENITDGLTLGFTITLGTGEFLEIDSDARTVLLGGTASRYNTLTTVGWFDLKPGVTELKFRGTTTGAPQLTAIWRSAWL